MKLSVILYLLTFQILGYSCNAQKHALKSTQHGLDMMLSDVSKEQLLEEMMFEDGKDDTVNVIRFDHVGPNLFPLIISSKLPVETDSLGILSFKLQRDTLDNFLYMIDNVSPKMYSRNQDYVLIRVTYRYEGRMEQYYITNAKIATGFLQMIEKKLISNRDDAALDKFYIFIARMKLQKAVKGKRVWTYYPL